MLLHASITEQDQKGLLHWVTGVIVVTGSFYGLMAVVGFFVATV